MRKRFLLAVLILAFIIPSVVAAQGDVKFASLDVDLWPEYDKAEMLVINHIVLASDTSLPASLNFHIPTKAKLHTVAIGPSLSSVSDQNVDFSTKVEGDSQVVSIQATDRAIQFEYYDPALEKKDANRHYVYQWVGDYEVQAFSVTFQAPVDSSNLEAVPPLEDIGPRSDGLTYYRSDFGTLPKGLPFSQEISYSKKTDALSISALDVQTVGTVDENTKGRIALANYLPYFLGGAVALLILGVFAYVWRVNRQPAGKPRRRRRSSLDQDQVEGETYCHQCGARARQGDRFCRVCGTRLRQDNE